MTLDFPDNEQQILRRDEAQVSVVIFENWEKFSLSEYTFAFEMWNVIVK